MKKLLAAAVALSLCTLAPSARAESGAEVWAAKCKGCHGEDGRAKTKIGAKERIPDLTDGGWQKRHDDAQIRDVIANGSKENAKMKAFKDKLTPGEIDALVQHVRSLEATH